MHRFKPLLLIASIFIALFLWVHPAHAAISLVAHTSKSSAGTTSGINTTGANLEVVYIAYDSNSAMSDSLGNTWTLVKNQAFGLSNSFGVMYYCFNPTTGSSQTFTAAVGYGQISVEAFSGVATSPLDQINGNSPGSTNTIQPGSVTPTQSNEVIITGTTFGGTTSGASIDSGFTVSDQNGGVSGSTYGGAMGYLIQGAASAVNPTWTTSAGASNQQTASVIATFFASAPPTGASSGIFQTMASLGTGVWNIIGNLFNRGSLFVR